MPHILVTSRLRQWGTVEGLDVFPLRELKEEEAVLFVKRGLNKLEDDTTKDSVIKSLVEKLQYSGNSTGYCIHRLPEGNRFLRNHQLYRRI